MEAEPGDNREFVHRVDARNQIISMNEEWCAFARENKVDDLTPKNIQGIPLNTFISGRETRYFFELMLKKVREGRGPVVFPFRCDAPDRRRFMEMTLRLAEDGSVEFSSRILRQEYRPAIALLEAGGPRSSAMLNCCGWCKKFELPSGKWDEAEQAVAELDLFGRAEMPRITHGVCPSCTSDFQSLIS